MNATLAPNDPIERGPIATQIARRLAESILSRSGVRANQPGEWMSPRSTS